MKKKNGEKMSLLELCKVTYCYMSVYSGHLTRSGHSDQIRTLTRLVDVLEIELFFPCSYLFGSVLEFKKKKKKNHW